MGSWLKAAADVPADFANAATGTGKNLGLAGKIDRGLDPRDISKEEQAKATEATNGISGFFAATTQVGAHTAGQAAEGAATGLRGSDAVPSWLKPVLGNSSALVAIVAGVAGLLLLGPLLEAFGAVAGE